MTNIQTNIGDLKRQIEDLQSITNANIARLQNHLQFTSSANFKDLSYIDQRNHLDALSNNGSCLSSLAADQPKSSGLQYPLIARYILICGPGGGN